MTDEVLSPGESELHCRNCGLRLVGRYCHGCSQDQEEGSPGLMGWIAETFEELTSIEGRTLRSIGALLTKPGALTAAWSDGQRLSYTRPLRVFLFALVLLLFVRSVLGSGPGFLPSAILGILEGASGPEAGVDQLAVLSQTDRILRGFTLALTPVVAGVVALFFRGRPFSQHFVFTLHVVAFALLLRTVFSFIELGSLSEDLTQLVQIACLLAYTFVAMRRVYRNSAPKTAVKLIAVAVVSVIIWVTVGAGVVALSLDSV